MRDGQNQNIVDIGAHVADVNVIFIGIAVFVKRDLFNYFIILFFLCHAKYKS